MKLMPCSLLSFSLAIALMVCVGCYPEQTNVSLTTSQLRQASQGKLVPIVMESDCVCTVSISRIRSVADRRGANLSGGMSESDLVAFAKRSADYTGRRISQLMKDNCWFESTASHQGTNCILRIRTYEKGVLARNDAFTKVADGEESIVRVTLQTYPSDERSLRPQLSVSPQAEKRIKEVAETLEEEFESNDRNDYALVDLTTLLNPAFYQRHAFSITGDDDTVVSVKGGDILETSAVVRKGTVVCVTNLVSALLSMELR